MSHNADYRLFQFAMENRTKPTAAEALLWEQLKNKQLNGAKFRRQHPIGNFILDFYCHAALLGIEVDGEYHNDPSQRAADEARSEALLEETGIKILRFSNAEVIQDIQGVMTTIANTLSFLQKN